MLYTVEVYLFLAIWLFCFLNDGGLLKPKSSGKKKIIGHFLLDDSRGVPRPLQSPTWFCRLDPSRVLCTVEVYLFLAILLSE